jgi:hypothetical protein
MVLYLVNEITNDPLRPQWGLRGARRGAADDALSFGLGN